ncbi:MAG TPA: hypothetical protein VFF06_33550 [Polyangia bacterium]|nr:hypothetical protein [Polyangia bacterium]
MRAAWLVIVGLVAGCSSTNVVVCDLDEFANADVAGRGDILDCGLALDDADAGATNRWADAQKCVLDAVAAKHGFILLFDVPDTTGRLSLRAGYTGYLAGGGRMVVHAYAFSAGLPNETNPTVSETVCNGATPLVDTNANPMTPCTPSPGSVCLTCNTTTVGALLCGFQP